VLSKALWLTLQVPASLGHSVPVAEQRRGITDVRAVRPHHHGLSISHALSAALLCQYNGPKCRELHDFLKQGARGIVWKSRELDLHFWKTIRGSSSWLSLPALRGLPSSSQDWSIIIYRLCLLPSLCCPERQFVPSSTGEKSLHYKYVKHMNSSDKRQNNNLFGKLTYTLLN